MNIKGVTLDGLDKIIAKMEHLSGEKLVGKGLEKTADLVQGEAKLLAPVGSPKYGGGDLRDSIKVSDVKDRQIEVFTNCDHALFNEFGTGTKGDPAVPHTSKEKWVYKGTDGSFHTSYGMAPRPFMRPAAEKGRTLIGDVFDEVYKEALEE